MSDRLEFEREEQRKREERTDAIGTILVVLAFVLFFWMLNR